MSQAKAAALTLLVSSACIGDTPASKLSPPDPSRIVVFYEFDGLVRGRGSPGAIGSTAEYVYIAAHPSGTITVPEVDDDGGFTFAIAATSHDVLEFAAAADVNGDERGTSVFLEIPRSPLPAADFICCVTPGQMRGNCQPAEAERICSESGQIVNPCFRDRDCAHLSGHTISLTHDAISISQPDVQGKVEVVGAPGKLPAFALVRLENRGQAGVGGVPTGFRSGVITDATGAFALEIFARGDDEIVFQVHALDGFRSLQHAVYVPDAELASLDVVGVFPMEGLAEEAVGKIGVRFAPGGIDGRGICPDSSESPALCFSGGQVGAGAIAGGIDYSMIDIRAFQIGTDANGDGGQSVMAVRASTTSVLPVSKFTDGDPLGGPQTLMLVLDNSDAANMLDEGPPRMRFSAARNFVNSLRGRDQLGIVQYGRDDPTVVIAPTSDKEALRAKVDELESASQSPIGNEDRLMFDGVIAAAQQLNEDLRLQRGAIMVLTSSEPTDAEGKFVEALTFVTPDPDTLAVGYPTFIASVGLANSLKLPDVLDLAQFSLGIHVDSPSPRGMLQSASEMTGRISGAYILVYDVPIPAGVGKTPFVKLIADLTLQQGEQAPLVATGEFVGQIEVLNAP